jgi:hypothetical protein
MEVVFFFVAVNFFDNLGELPGRKNTKDVY